MKAVGELEENAVASHGVGDARTGQNHNVERAKSGDGHGHGKPNGSARTGKFLHNV
jgi:hypothetical protein